MATKHINLKGDDNFRAGYQAAIQDIETWQQTGNELVPDDAVVNLQLATTSIISFLNSMAEVRQNAKLNIKDN